MRNYESENKTLIARVRKGIALKLTFFRIILLMSSKPGAFLFLNCLSDYYFGLVSLLIEEIRYRLIYMHIVSDVTHCQKLNARIRCYSCENRAVLSHQCENYWSTFEKRAAAWHYSKGEHCSPCDKRADLSYHEEIFVYFDLNIVRRQFKVDHFTDYALLNVRLSQALGSVSNFGCYGCLSRLRVSCGID